MPFTASRARRGMCMSSPVSQPNRRAPQTTPSRRDLLAGAGSLAGLAVLAQRRRAAADWTPPARNINVTFWDSTSVLKTKAVQRAGPPRLQAAPIELHRQVRKHRDRESPAKGSESGTGPGGRRVRAGREGLAAKGIRGSRSRGVPRGSGTGPPGAHPPRPEGSSGADGIARLDDAEWRCRILPVVVANTSRGRLCPGSRTRTRARRAAPSASARHDSRDAQGLTASPVGTEMAP